MAEAVVTNVIERRAGSELAADTIPVAAPYATEVMADTPSLYCRLGASGLTDISGFSHDLTAVGSPTIGGVSPGAVAGDDATGLNGSSQYFTSTYVPWTDNSLRTFEGWAWRNNTSTAHTLFNSDTHYAPALILASGSGDVTFSSAAGAPDPGDPTWTAAWPGTAQWVHWALVIRDSPKTSELYINGTSLGSNSHTYNYAAGTKGNFLVGARDPGTGAYWDGNLDEIAVYEAELTPTRIAVHAAAP